MMKTWGVGLIGCGSVSSVHLQALSQMPNVRLLAVCDIQADRANKAAAQYGCRAFTDYHDLLKLPEINAVHITAPHHLHAPMTLDALSAGKKVLTEKPISSDLADAQKMVEAAKAGTLAVCFQNRYNASSQKAREIIESGQYGKLITLRGIVTWHREAPYYTESGWRGDMSTEGGGVLINQSIHTLDLLLWFAGAAASVKGSVSTDSLSGVIEVEDSAHFMIRFQSGVRGIFYATIAYGIDAPILVEAVLEKAILQLRGDSLYLIEGGEETLLVPTPVNSLGQKGYWGVSHRALIEDFYRHLENGEHFWIDAQVGYNALKVLKSVYQSSQENKEIFL